MQRNAASSRKQSTSCELGLSISKQAEMLTPEGSIRMQTNELEGFHESSSTPQVPLPGKVPLVPGNSTGAGCAVQGAAKVDDATEGNCKIKMEAETSCNAKKENPSSANVCLVVSPYGCGVCSRSFEEVDALLSHVLTCPWPEPFRCGLCPELCTNWGTTRSHLIAHITRGTPKCPLCGHAFGKHWTVERHVQRHHVPIRPFVCNCCGGAFTAKADIQKHSLQCRANSQTVEKYLGSSEKCDSQVRSHLPTTVYKCSVCASAFLDRLVIARHMRIHLNQLQHSRKGEGPKKHPFDCGNHRSYGIGPPKVKQGVKAYTQCFIKIHVADKTTCCKAISKATQANLRSTTVSSWTQCDDLEDSEDDL
ncbi:zinc finger protein 26-like [Rhipicephalus sanguineus]|uniref:zinc finger protein 26-like n=1 Tax=Rhipicephalus sanguineus TaxID=34632 RepID=UPI0020C3371C|nr:zinc finger protein 26-like [Rhipicephalus sanguineus]XP_049274406.1 zinc finger protein 26-like [Rhipicephalus sanguineus]